ncbi:RNA-binding motif protein, X-linked 2 [Hypsibius exemplaris]|uniref:RNA-binding motif protein, X-linked 2 n=1 Tax=Hypsibius exemplaris TaxID=2072580 RepID=A0A1W0XE62_HYPEX|nr:RNA-binding motif protein, X-linked 2 [Hypsibius exemplaris]
MNPLTNTRKINELNEREAKLGISEDKSWHQQYKDSAWIFVGGLPYELSEGDIICIFSQYGEPVNINLVRDQKSGKSKGFCFICYEDQRSTILAVDNFNGTKICGRTIRVDHVANYKAPKEGSDDEIKKMLAEVGCGPDVAKELERKAASIPLALSGGSGKKKEDDSSSWRRSRSPSPRQRDRSNYGSNQRGQLTNYRTDQPRDRDRDRPTYGSDRERTRHDDRSGRSQGGPTISGRSQGGPTMSERSQGGPTISGRSQGGPTISGRSQRR